MGSEIAIVSEYLHASLATTIVGTRQIIADIFIIENNLNSKVQSRMIVAKIKIIATIGSSQLRYCNLIIASILRGLVAARG